MNNENKLAILNLAAYRFSPIIDLELTRGLIYDAGKKLGVRGTILVTPEGLNAFFAAEEQACREMLENLRKLPGFQDLYAKESWSKTVPFERFKVKLKKEIIRMDHPTIRPAAHRAPSVDAKTLQRWLDCGHDDEGRSVVMLDTRNDFEVKVGKFKNATQWNIQKFTQFPEAVISHRESLLNKTVVSYCTGGIRCEKAALYMHEVGLNNVLQLDGGILKYFEETDSRHWEGECFVFDEREALGPDLSPIK
jgi:UPF0176 protein